MKWRNPDCRREIRRTKLGPSSESNPSNLHSHLRFPCLVHIPATKDLPLLQEDHIPPLGDVDRIDKAAGLDAEASSLGVSRGAVDGGHVDVLSCVELESRLGAVDLEVEAGVGVAELAQQAQGLAAGVEWDLRWVGFDDEDIVDMWACCVEVEGLGHFAGEGGYLPLWDACRVEGQVVFGCELGDSA